MSKLRVVVPALCLVTFCASIPGRSSRAGQLAASPSQTPISLPDLLDSFPYDAARRGPLLLLSGFRAGRTTLYSKGMSEKLSNNASLSSLAEALKRRVVGIGMLTVLAPSTMRVIVENPGKPNIYAGLRAEQRFKILLSLFSTAQWRLAGSKRGIGLADMDEAQHGLFLSLLPEKMTLQHVKLVPTDKPFENQYERQGNAEETDPSAARLRLIRKVNFQFSKPGAEDTSVRSSVEPSAGDEINILEGNRQPRGDMKPDPDTTIAFGTPIIQTVPNRLKPGHINFAASVLQKGVVFDGNIKTLGDLLNRVASVTRLDLVADKRIVNLPLFLRFAPHQSARAGEILQALCWSVTGAFRRVGVSTYLLTDDVHGIGTRWARLDEWAEAASWARDKAVRELTNGTAKHDPLAHIGFASGNSHSLPPALLQRIDDAYRKDRYNPPPFFRPSELPEALQQTIEHNREFWEENHITIQTDRVRVGTELSAQFVMPGNVAVEVPFAQNIGSQYLEEIAAAPRIASLTNAATRPSAKPMPPNLRKRVLLARLPDENSGGVDLLTTAKAKGFSEIWLHVRFDDTNAPVRMKAAIAAGKKAGIGIGLLVSLLHDGGLAGAEDINIFEETGSQFAKRRAATAQENMRGYYQRMAGWTVSDTVLDKEETARRVSTFARIAGLSAMALKATAAPGWAGYSAGGDAIPWTGHLGYGVVTRLAYLRAEGIDPLDVTRYSYTLGEQVDLPFFPCTSEELWQSLLNFRLRENKRVMADLYTALRQAAPDLPLYLDDRASSYADPNTRWYARWDKAERLPVNPVSAVESEARTAAFAHSSEPLLCLRGWNGKPEYMARIFGDVTQRAAKNWRGVTLDLTNLTTAETQRMLNGLPKAAMVNY